MRFSMPTTGNVYATVRYTEDGGCHKLLIYTEEAAHESAGTPEARPDWLTRIVDLAVVGGHLHPIPNPPPTRILWFDVDKDYNLIEFVSFGPARDTPPRVLQHISHYLGVIKPRPLTSKP